MDHYADDLAQLIDELKLRNVSIVGFSASGGEVARFVGRHGTRNQIVPIDLAARVVEKMLPSAEVKFYEGAPHGLTFTRPR